MSQKEPTDDEASNPDARDSGPEQARRDIYALHRVEPAVRRCAVT